ncbi:MAG: transposase [Rhizobiales bacterium]|nr:transposase [Hyphomicrobiales bacterium]MBO6700365.1 transposase [Hyphomicrobiales bacterium]MBO6737471.1 transposase [Hyphomicrobiales bacterium]MBO6913472.1 transposase [Hyphomicrobiales bacterium]MBO6955403.1 transposase [Hyphomicrobiales bacterium]
MEIGYKESVNNQLRDELLNVGLFNDRREANGLVDKWKRHFNPICPHNLLG